MKRLKGFTLIEVIVTVAIMGILLALGIPSLSEYIQNARLRASASELRDGLMTARMEAIRRNATISITVAGQDASNNPLSWNIATISRSRIAPKSERSFVVTHTDSAGTVTTLNTSTSASVSFGGDGRTSAGAGSFNIYAAGGASSCQADGGALVCMRVTVGTGGVVRMCNPVFTLANDPQGC